MSSDPAGFSPTDGRAAVFPGDQPFAAEDLRRVAASLHADASSPVGRAATPRHARMARRLRVLGLRAFRDYCALVADAGIVDERQRRLATLAAHPSRFFSEPHHFEHLSRVVLPPLLEAARRGGRVRLWSAGCGDGAEAYSLGMAVLDLAPEAAALDVKILGSDIDAELVGQAQRGRVSASALPPAPDGSAVRWFKPLRSGADTLEAGRELKTLVVFRELDLAADWPMRGRFEAVFCRNAAIHLDEEAQGRLWAGFAARMRPGARLYVGPADRLSGAAADRFAPDGAAIHRRTAAA